MTNEKNSNGISIRLSTTDHRLLTAEEEIKKHDRAFSPKEKKELPNMMSACLVHWDCHAPTGLLGNIHHMSSRGSAATAGIRWHDAQYRLLKVNGIAASA